MIDMLHGPIARKLIVFALPVAASALLQQLLNATDVAVVGQFASSNAMAAVGANTFVINLMLNLFIGLSVGTNVVIARHIGARKTDQVRQAVHTSITLALVCGVLMSVVGWFVARPILSLMGTPADILDLAVLYFRIYFLGMPFIMLYNFQSAIMRSIGDTRRPLYIMAFSGVINVLLNLLLVVRFHLTVEGVAIATLVSSAISSLSLLFILMKENSDVQVQLRHLGFNLQQLRLIAAVGVPAGIQGMIFNISNVLIQGGINSLGTACVAANTATLNFDYLCFFVGNAFGQAGTSFLSQNYGARNVQRCWRIVRDSMFLGPGATLVVSMLFVALAPALAGFFTNDPYVILLSVQRMQVVITFYSIHSFNEILSGQLRALGYSAVPATINIVFICGIRIAWRFLVFPNRPEFGFLMYCYPISWIINIAVLMPVFFFLVRRKLRSLTLVTT